jgi:hypothetical protein
MGSSRHIVKSSLFWAAALRADQPQRAVDLLAGVFDQAVVMSLRPLIWPIVTVLGDRATPQQRSA